jgi:hypothetical protein
MNNNQPVLHLSLYVDCSPSQKRELRKLLSSYTQRIDQWSPVVDISIDSYDKHVEKREHIEDDFRLIGRYIKILQNPRSHQIRFTPIQ